MLIQITVAPQVLSSKSRGPHGILNSRGQGVVEFVLILIVSVSIILAVMNQFYKPFGQWASNYMGEYLQCLLEAGELPSLGGEGSVGECNQNFSKASFSSGRVARNSPTGVSIPSGGEGGGSKGSSSGGGSGGGSRGADSRGGVDRLSASPQKGPSGGGEKDATAGPTQAPSSQFAKRNTAAAFQLGKDKKIRANGLTGYLAQLKKKKEESDRQLSRGLASEPGSSRPKKIAVKKKGKSGEMVEKAESEFSLGSLFRVFLIIILLIIMFVFFGGQALQISKSWEK